MKKDPGIPNLFPYKEKLLHEIEEKKRLKEEESLRLREEARQRRGEVGAEELSDAAAGVAAPRRMADEDDDDLVDEDDDMDQSDGDESGNPMAALLASAKARATGFAGQKGDGEDGDEMDEDVSDMDDEEATDDDFGDDDEDGGAMLDAPSAAPKETSRKAFDKIFKQVTEAADVVLYVLDARDPEGTRSKQVERDIMAANGGSKRLILILNKIDLVPPQVLKGWLVHLRRYFPTLPLRASTGAPNAQSFDHKQLTVKGTSETLFKALKAYSQGKQLKRSIAVGVIGYPNVGKSSVINALMSRLSRGSSGACPVGAEAGVTTNLREVKLDSKLKLIDSPGIVFPNIAAGKGKLSSSSSSSSSQSVKEGARLILLNAIPAKHISDPVPAVTLLLKRLSKAPARLSKMQEFYGIPTLIPASNGDTTNDFLVQVARKCGRLGKGGVPNINSAAMTVVTDWRDGRIQGWLEAPELQVSTANSGPAVSGSSAEPSADTKRIVSEWSKEFQLEGLWGDDEDTADGEMVE